MWAALDSRHNLRETDKELSSQRKIDIMERIVGLPRWGGSEGKESASNVGDRFRFLDQEDPLEKKMPTHSSIFAQRIMWTEEPGGLQSMGSQRDIL